ncbi:hypothetical protein F5884DRAFT_800586 [Xylogone sp. PMI_703]|nr:hypothetical protein F5884DRAFT_800586 [Xylogone sp. PMI_703]
MADPKTIPQGHNGKDSNPQTLPRSKGPSKAQQLNKLYTLPAPLRTFPLPAFVPHNPVSLFHLLYAWVSQAIRRPSSHFDILYQAWFSPETRSVHVTDTRSIRGLWEQGFYGKGSLSRSEPSWLDREKTRRGSKSNLTSEEVTRQRRAERQQAKWERARKEREAIDKQLLEEAQVALNAQVMDQHLPEAPNLNSQVTKPEKPTEIFPVGPLELLALPNSLSDLIETSQTEIGATGLGVEFTDEKCSVGVYNVRRTFSAPTGPLQLLSLPNSNLELLNLTAIPGHPREHISNGTRSLDNMELSASSSNSSIGSQTSDSTVMLNGDITDPESQFQDLSNGPNGTIHGSPDSNGPIKINGDLSNGSATTDSSASPTMKRRKSVRFSPTVEHNTFFQTEPPTPKHAAIVVAGTEGDISIIRDQEHFQLTMEEAFFLSYALGALQVLDPNTKAPISNEDLFALFRRTSYFPPRLLNAALAPDDPFLVSYVVYHHFRSLGWVVRGGTKFSVDYLLYNRGPVFSHAEFAILVLPSYSDPYWSSDAFLQNYVKAKEKGGKWSWVHCVNRVLAQVKKTLVLVYVDIPAPLSGNNGETEQALGIDGVLARYKVREFVVKRWLSNRMRD